MKKDNPMTLYDELRQQANNLTPEEQLRLIAELAEQVRRNKPQAATLYYWHDLQGIGQHPLTGEDAQTWVTRSRQESDSNRNQTLPGLSWKLKIP